MTDLCAAHRPYLGALADDQVELVPTEAQEHVMGCETCSQEVRTHRLLDRKLRSGVAAGLPSAVGTATPIDVPNQVPRRRQRRAAVAAAVLALGGAGGIAVWQVNQEPAGMSAALAASAAPPQFRSQDAAAIRLWCEGRSGRPMETTGLPGVTPVGARMDKAGGIEVVTIEYQTPGGEHLAVSWLDATGSAQRETSVQSRVVAGRIVLMVHSVAGAAVISGDAQPSVLWAAAGALQAASR